MRLERNDTLTYYDNNYQVYYYFQYSIQVAVLVVGYKIRGRIRNRFFAVFVEPARSNVNVPHVRTTDCSKVPRNRGLTPWLTVPPIL